MTDTIDKALGRNVRLGPGVSICLECGGVFSTDGLIVCGCDTITKNTGDPTGVVLALWLPEPLARTLALPDGIAGGLPWEFLHVTLAFLGRMQTIDPAFLDRLLTVVPQFVDRHAPLFAEVGGIGLFPPGDDNTVTAYVPVDAPDLAGFRQSLVELLDAAGVPYNRGHGFTPHVTLGTWPNGQVPPIDPAPALPFEFGAVTLAIGPRRIDWPLHGAVDPLAVMVKNEAGITDEDVPLLRALADQGDLDAVEALSFVMWNNLGRRTEPAASDEATTTTEVRFGVSKRAEPDRFTFGPLYVPEFLDAHGDYSVADDLQKSVWEYVRGGDRRIRLQHDLDTVAGEWVELAVWPDEVRTRLVVPDGGGVAKAGREVRFPPGTPFMGVVWSEDVWPRIERGDIRGYSIGGRARRLTVDLAD